MILVMLCFSLHEVTTSKMSLISFHFFLSPCAEMEIVWQKNTGQHTELQIKEGSTSWDSTFGQEGRQK